jgi:hypothetical protein
VTSNALSLCKLGNHGRGCLSGYLEATPLVYSATS